MLPLGVEGKPPPTGSSSTSATWSVQEEPSSVRAGKTLELMRGCGWWPLAQNADWVQTDFSSICAVFPKICRSSWWNPAGKRGKNSDIKRILEKEGEMMLAAAGRTAS